MQSGIYGIHNLVNGKWYVGQASNIRKRWNAHRSLLSRNASNSVQLQRAWNKYGADSFEWIVLEECEIADLDEKEMRWISEKDSYKNGYNRTVGGGGLHGFRMSDAQKEKHRAATAESWKDSSIRENRISAMRSAMSTSEYKENLKRAMQNKWSDKEFRDLALKKMQDGSNNPETRLKISESSKAAMARPETKARISIASKRRWEDPLFREKILESRKAAMSTDEYKKKLSASSKKNWENAEHREKVSRNTSAALRRNSEKVIQVETGTTYSCIAEASEMTGISHAHISSACAAKRRTAGGFHWMYASDSQSDWDARRKAYIEKSGIKAFRKVMCVETGEIFEQPKFAAEKIGVHPSNIAHCCNGRQEKSGGYHWTYVD